MKLVTLVYSWMTVDTHTTYDKDLSSATKVVDSPRLDQQTFIMDVTGNDMTPCLTAGYDLRDSWL